jgi:hypothetical protein
MLCFFCKSRPAHMFSFRSSSAFCCLKLVLTAPPPPHPTPRFVFLVADGSADCKFKVATFTFGPLAADSCSYAMRTSPPPTLVLSDIWFGKFKAKTTFLVAYFLTLFLRPGFVLHVCIQLMLLNFLVFLFCLLCIKLYLCRGVDPVLLFGPSVSV